MVKVKYPVRARILSPIVALGVLGIFVLGATPAYAHDQLVGSTPADGTSLATAPKRITLFFEEPPAAGFTSLTVTAPDGSRVDSGSHVTRGSTLMTTLRPLTVCGHYTVTFRIMSDDGHPIAGTLGFTLARAAAGKATSAGSNRSVAQSPAPPAGPSADSQSFGPTWLPLGVVAAAVLSAAVALAARRSRTRASGTTG